MQQELRHVARSYALLLDRGVDVVHDHTQAGMGYAGHPIGVPIALTMHGPFLPAAQELLNATSRRIAVVAISHHQAETAGPVRVSRVIHHGIDVDEIYAGTGEGGYLVFLGRITPDKGIREAIEVAARAGFPVTDCGQNARTVRTGSFADAVLVRCCRPASSTWEKSTHDEKVELLRRAVALINPIQWPEPFGMVMIEAMAAGTPVIATPRGSAPEIVVDGVTGYLQATVEGLVRAVGEVGQLDRVLTRRHVQEHFSMDRMAGDYAQLFESLKAAHDGDPTAAELATS